MQGKLTDLNESVTWEGATVEDGIIKGIKLLGEKSKNGNRYPQATRKKAHAIMEGIRVNLNHLGRNKQGEERAVESRIGKLINVREGDGGTYADLHFLTTHPMSAALAEAAKRMPDLYGLSINGRGTVKNHKGESIVESIDSLKSVDLVADPGTTKGLFESALQEQEEETAKTSEQLLGELVAALVAEGKDDLVKDVMKLRKKMSGNGNGDSEAPEAPAEAPTEESWKQEYDSLKLEKECRTLCESAKVTPDSELVESLMAMNSDKARNDFIAWHKRTRSVKTVKSEPLKVGDKVEPNWTTILRGR